MLPQEENSNKETSELTSRFLSLSISGFRRLKSFEVQLKPMIVLIGANNVGKTSFLDAWSLISSSAKGHMQDTFSEMGGFIATLSGNTSHQLQITLSFSLLEEKRLRYDLRLSQEGTDYRIIREEMTQSEQEKKVDLGPHTVYLSGYGNQISYLNDKDQAIIKPEWDYNYKETALSQVPKFFNKTEKFRQTLSSTIHYKQLDVGPKAPVRLPQPMRPSTLPGPNGEELISCLFTLSQTDRDRFERIEDILRAGFPTFERLEFPPVAAGTLALTWKDSNFDQPFYMNQLSEGTLRFLWLVTLLQSPGLSQVTLIDEPEVSLHPELIELFVEVAREASLRTQLIIATHHDRLIRFLQPEEVLILDTDEEGWTTGTWGNELDLEAWGQEYSLDELWRLGRLGGRS